MGSVSTLIQEVFPLTNFFSDRAFMYILDFSSVWASYELGIGK